MLYWIDLVALVIFLAMAGLVPPGSGGGGSPGWTWTWERIPWLLTAMAIIRILLMAFTARYSHGNYNATVIFACVLMTLVMMFQINMIIQHRMALSIALIVQYTVSIILTQFHWISYSAHTPMSATLAYAYDPLLHDSITFSRESRYLNGNGHSGVNGGVNGNGNGVYPHGRPTTALRRGTSYGTMSNSPFDAVQELDEEQDDDDQDVFIKVNVDRRQSAIRVTGAGGSDDNDTSDEEGVEDEEEEQDMATLLASQEQRRLQAYGRTTTTTTTSPSAGPARTALSPQMILSGDAGTPIKSPLSWAFRGTHDAASTTSSYGVRMAASGIPGAAAIAGESAAGGLTVGYGTPRRRPFKTGRDLNGTGRRTWTGGHSIIYSGIFVDDESDDDNDDEGGNGDGRDGNEAGDLGGASEVEGEDIDAIEKLAEVTVGGEGERNEKEDVGGDAIVSVDHSQEQLIFDDTIKAEIDSSFETTENETGVSVDVVNLEGAEQDGDDVKVEVGSSAGVTVKVGITETTKRATVRETKTVHRHGLKITGPGHSEDGSIIGNLVDVDGRLVVGEVLVVDGGIDRTSTPDKGVVDGETKPGPHPHFDITLPAGDDAENATAIDRPYQEPKSSGRPHGDQFPEGNHHGLSTLRFNISSRKDITAVICDDEDCEEHPYQEGPAAELEAATGYTGKGHIVQLDIKESETNAEERTGDGINDFEDSSDSGTILGLPDHHHRRRIDDGSGGGLEVLPVGTITIRKGKEGNGHTHESTEVIAGVGSVEVTDPGVLVVPVTGTVDPQTSKPGVVVGVVMEGDGEGEGVHRRIHIHERRERVTIEEEDEIGVVGVHGVHGVYGVHGIHGFHGGHGIHGTVVLGDSSEDGRIGGVVVVEGDNSGPILVPPRHRVPGQWIDIDGQGPPEGVITWGIADDIPPYIQQEGVIIGSGPEPVVIQAPPAPVYQPIVRPPAPVYQPIVQPPAIVAPPPPQLPPPQVLYQPQPRAVVPAMVAPAPVVAPTYGTYETIVPGAVGGVAGVGGVGMRGVGVVGAVGGGVVGGGGIGGIGGRPYSVASIYDDQSVVSIYERENYDLGDVASIYDDRSIVSIDGIGHGP
ncbi:hypothetical protein BGZ90_001615, partial [Linnemannia elongata]